MKITATQLKKACENLPDPLNYEFDMITVPLLNAMTSEVPNTEYNGDQTQYIEEIVFIKSPLDKDWLLYSATSKGKQVFTV
jgi:hypothetical protein